MTHSTSLSIDEAADVVDQLAPYLKGDRYHRAVCAVQRRIFVVAPWPHFALDWPEGAPWEDAKVVETEGFEVKELRQSYDSELIENSYRTAIAIGQ